MSTTAPLPTPNFTTIPNVFFDDILPQITSLAELKVTLAIMRKTFGWRKSEDLLSFSQLEILTGLGRQAISSGLTQALQRGTVTRRPAKNGFIYGLNLACDFDPKLVHDSYQYDSQTSPQFIPKSVHNSYHSLVCDSYSQKKEEKERKKDMSSPSVSKVVRSLFEYWQEALNHPQAKLTPEKEKAIRARLKDGYTPDQIKAAFDGCGLSPFHLGQNDQGKRYDQITLICRDGSKLESFIEMNATPKSKERPMVI